MNHFQSSSGDHIIYFPGELNQNTFLPLIFLHSKPARHQSWSLFCCLFLLMEHFHESYIALIPPNLVTLPCKLMSCWMELLNLFYLVSTTNIFVVFFQCTRSILTKYLCDNEDFFLCIREMKKSHFPLEMCSSNPAPFSPYSSHVKPLTTLSVLTTRCEDGATLSRRNKEYSWSA